jgi:hypothetical protein
MRTNHCARLNQSPYHVDALKISRCRRMMMLKELTAAIVVLRTHHSSLLPEIQGLRIELQRLKVNSGFCLLSSVVHSPFL